jgi:hypothetical protein
MHCGAVSKDEHCWCESLPALKKISAQEGCFCKSCLEKALAAEKGATTERT